MDAFIQFFKQHLDTLEQHYTWPKRVPKAVPNAPWVFETTGAAECIAMKHHLTSTWATANDRERSELARWIVSDWGGVRTNDPTTLAAYVTSISSGDFLTPLQGVASYSKILSMANCTQYAIYDARVAACLNAVQLLMKSTNPLFFPYIPGRNTTIQGNKTNVGFVQVFPKQELVTKRGWQEVKKEASYATYLELLHGLKQHFPNHEIYHFEMALFSMAPELCSRAIQNDRARETMTRSTGI